MADIPDSNASSQTRPAVVLDSVELTAHCGTSVERLSYAEYLLLEQFLSFPEKPLQTDSLQETLPGVDGAHRTRSDTEKKLRKLMATVNALHPAFPLVRRLGKDTWIYTEVKPLKKGQKRTR